LLDYALKTQSKGEKKSEKPFNDILKLAYISLLGLK